MKKLKESLIKSAQYGDIDALDIIIKEFSISAYYYAVKALNDHDDAEESRMRALEKIGKRKKAVCRLGVDTDPCYRGEHAMLPYNQICNPTPRPIYATT